MQPQGNICSIGRTESGQYQNNCSGSFATADVSRTQDQQETENQVSCRHTGILSGHGQSCPGLVTNQTEDEAKRKHRKGARVNPSRSRLRQQRVPQTDSGRVPHHLPHKTVREAEPKAPRQKSGNGVKNRSGPRSEDRVQMQTQYTGREV